MTTAEIEKLWLLVPHKLKHHRQQYCMDWLESMALPYSTSNNGIHIQLIIHNTEVNIWPTTKKIRFDGVTYTGTDQIIKQLRKLLASEE